MARKDEDFLELLAHFPWWVSVCFSAIVYMLKFIVPSITFDNPFLKGMSQIAPQLAWMAIIFLLPAGASIFESFRKSKLLDRQSGIESIRALSWRHFEELIAEAYRRQGYMVKENTSLGADGGVDLRIEKNGDRYLVQCKQWLKNKVDVKIVREMYGLMTAERASGAIIVTSGIFTQEAKNFASDKPLDLVEGSHLVTLLKNVSTTPIALADRSPNARCCPGAATNWFCVRQSAGYTPEVSSGDALVFPLADTLRKSPANRQFEHLHRRETSCPRSSKSAITSVGTPKPAAFRVKSSRCIPRM